MFDLTYHSIQRTMETMIIRRRQSEDSKTTVVKGGCPIRRRWYVEEVRYSEFIAFDPVRLHRR